MLQLKGRTNSSNVMKAPWIPDEIGLAYEREDVGGQFGKNRGTLPEPQPQRPDPNDHRR